MTMRPCPPVDRATSRILEHVAELYDLPVIEIRCGGNDHRSVAPRFMAAYLIRELLKDSLPRIGKVLGGRHHTTIWAGLRRFQAALVDSKELRDMTEHARIELLAVVANQERSPRKMYNATMYLPPAWPNQAAAGGAHFGGKQ